jgi:8-oxo-dGTP pyrophosphatase MutT (NUDIX family)
MGNRARLLDLLRDRLDPVDGDDLPAARGDGDLNGSSSPSGRELRPAAVLAPLILHDGPARLLLTERAAHLNNHGGQISFPGGRIEASDASSSAAALREVEEEIGIGAAHVELIGRFDAYETVTGFQVTPFVGVLKPGFAIRPDANEVADVFDTPFDFLMDPANHQHQSRVWNGKRRYYYAMPWQDRYIWGATAGMLKALYDRLYG